MTNQPSNDGRRLGERQTHQLLFIADNMVLPRTGVVNTARRGDKWMKLAKPGDILKLAVKPPNEDEDRKPMPMGEAVVLDARLVTLWDILTHAHINHAGQLAAEAKAQANSLANAGPRAVDPASIPSPQQAVLDALVKAYGPELALDEPFTNLAFVRYSET